MAPAGVFSTQALSASRVSPKLNSPPPSGASHPPPGGRVKGTWRSEVLGIRGAGCELAATCGYFPLLSARLRRGGPENRRRPDDVDAGRPNGLHLPRRPALAPGDDRAGVPHAP